MLDEFQQQFHGLFADRPFILVQVCEPWLSKKRKRRVETENGKIFSNDTSYPLGSLFCRYCQRILESKKSSNLRMLCKMTGDPMDHFLCDMIGRRTKIFNPEFLVQGKTGNSTVLENSIAAFLEYTVIDVGKEESYISMSMRSDIGKPLGNCQHIVGSHRGLPDHLDILINEDQWIFVDDHLKQSGIQKLRSSRENDQSVYRSTAHAEDGFLFTLGIIMGKRKEKVCFPMAGVCDGGDCFKTKMIV